jgi:uncharacterized protein Yka (UPF0111/DUF47 family)
VKQVFGQLREVADFAVTAALRLQGELSEPIHHDHGAIQLKELEGRADNAAREILESLHSTFVTPLDRELLEALVRRLDDVVDAIEAAGERIWLYQIDAQTPEARELGRVLVEATRKVSAAVAALSESRGTTLRALVIEVNRLENEADGLLQLALARLFRGAGPAIEILKWKEIYESIEAGIDRCEDVANVLEEIALEYCVMA